jgi:hypothetical protein
LASGNNKLNALSQRAIPIPIAATEIAKRIGVMTGTKI